MTFMAQIEHIVPRGEWFKIIRPCYHPGARGNMPYDLRQRLRLYLSENLYTVSDKSTMAEVIDSHPSTKNGERQWEPDAHQAKKAIHGTLV